MDQIINADVSLIIRLILAHLLADFLFQKKNWIEERVEKKWRAKSLYLHVAIVGMLTWAFSGNYQNIWIPVFIVITHYITDLWKSYSGNSLRNFILDQIIHIVIIFIAWLLYLKIEINIPYFLQELFTNQKIMAIITGYFFVIWPSGFLIAKITENWQNQISNTGLNDAGKWIGIFERILILTFVLINQFSGIGFLIAAKSILRFGEIKNAAHRKDAEYILIGTMVSFITAILTGLLISVCL